MFGPYFKRHLAVPFFLRNLSPTIMTKGYIYMTYDPDNIFAKILRGEIPNETVYEDDHVLAFNDIAPHAPIHVLVIPKGPYTDMHDFSAKASAEEITAYVQSFSKIATILGIEKEGYRMISNCKDFGMQEVPHLHCHILSGEQIGPMRSTL